MVYSKIIMITSASYSSHRIFFHLFSSLFCFQTTPSPKQKTAFHPFPDRPWHRFAPLGVREAGTSCGPPTRSPRRPRSSWATPASSACASEQRRRGERWRRRLSGWLAEIFWVQKPGEKRRGVVIFLRGVFFGRVFFGF